MIILYVYIIHNIRSFSDKYIPIQTHFNHLQNKSSNTVYETGTSSIFMQLMHDAYKILF